MFRRSGAEDAEDEGTCPAPSPTDTNEMALRALRMRLNPPCKIGLDLRTSGSLGYKRLKKSSVARAARQLDFP